MGKHYTKDEDDFIRKYYAPGKAKDIGGLLNRAPKAIMNRAWVLGITKKRKSSTTSYSVPVSAPKIPHKEKPIKAAQFIKDNYTKLTNEEISKVTGWKIKSITICASKLGLKKPKHLKQIINQWGGIKIISSGAISGNVEIPKAVDMPGNHIVSGNVCYNEVPVLDVPRRVKITTTGDSQSGISLDNNFGNSQTSDPKFIAAQRENTRRIRDTLDKAMNENPTLHLELHQAMHDKMLRKSPPKPKSWLQRLFLKLAGE